jgi:hypothetical protein
MIAECAGSTPRWIEVESTFELAIWCRLLRERGWTGARIAYALGRSEGYVNNLIRIVERASMGVLVRWRHEQQPGSDLAHACATDWLMQVCLLPHDRQDDALAQRVQRLGERGRDRTSSA